jgi:hypothetical protein
VARVEARLSMFGRGYVVVVLGTKKLGNRRGRGAIARAALAAAALAAVALAAPSIASAQYPTPGAPALTAGSNPTSTGLFTLEWTGAEPVINFGLSYTLQHHDAASETWTTVASGIEALSFEFTGAGEAEGTWVYRVQGVDSVHEETTEFSAASESVVVDKTAPNPPTASADRAPDFAENGGWYKDNVIVSFTAAGDPALSDGSPGSGVEPASLSSPQTFSTSGPFTASGTVADNAGNVSAAGTLLVQVDATAPSLEVKCPATALVGEAGVTATVTASDAESGLAIDPSGSVPINTEQVGPVTVTRTAVDNVGHETTRSCTTNVIESPPEFGRCSKVRPHGFFTNSTCATKSSTQTSLYEWTPGVVHKGLTYSLSTSAVFETVSRSALTCTGGSGSGTITTPRTIGSLVLKFTGCVTNNAAANSCTTAGRATGEIETKALEGALGVWRITIKEGKETRSVGLNLFPVGRSGPFVEFNCGETITPVVLKGGIIAQLPADKMLTSETEKYTDASGKQKPERFLGGEKQVLTKANGEQVGLKVSMIHKYEEPVEIDAYF